MRHLLLSTVALAALSCAALAADLPSTKAPPVYTEPTPVFTWTGFYLGADIGGGWAHTSDQFVSNLVGPISRSASGSGVVGGGYVGYNYQINQFVLGVQGDFQGSGISGRNYDAVVDTTEKGSQNWLGAFNGRLGFAFDRALVYAIGGVAFTQSHTDVIVGPTFGPALTRLGLPTTLGYSHSWTGYDIGAGVEYAFTNNWIGRVEYRYYDFGSWNYPANSWAPAGRDKLSDSTVTVGLSYLFGAPSAALPAVAKY